MSKITVDETLPIPMHYQLYEILLNRIKTNEWSVNQKIPTERELCDLFKVSRITVRQALSVLAKEGYLYRKQGRGTFVTLPRIEQPLNQFYSFSDAIRKLGYKAKSIILSFDCIPCPIGISQQLRIPEGDTLYRIKRLRLADSEPFAVETSYVPQALCEGLVSADIETMGLYEALRVKGNLNVQLGEESIEAILIPADDAGILHVKKNAAGLYLERLAGTEDLQVEFCTTLIRGDRYKYKIILGKSRLSGL